jgi:hypothetical protein
MSVLMNWRALLAWWAVGKRNNTACSSISGQDAEIERFIATSPGLLRTAHKCKNSEIPVLRALSLKISEFGGRLGTTFVGRQRIPLTQYLGTIGDLYVYDV